MKFAKTLINTIDANFKIKKLGAIYKFVKSGKCDGRVKVFSKAKNIPEVLKTISNIASQSIEVTKMPN